MPTIRAHTVAAHDYARYAYGHWPACNTARIDATRAAFGRKRRAIGATPARVNTNGRNA
jgi:hypothetical protein